MTRIVSLTALVAALAAIAAARPAPSTHTVHEKRYGLHHRWTNPLRIRSESDIHVRVGLKQSNLHRGHEYLMDVSHPDSENYGKFWTEEEVTEMFAPSDESVNVVKAWLVESGIRDARITHSDNKGWLAFIATGEELENLLHADFYQYEDSETGHTAVSTERYHVPKHIKEHIDYITPGIRFPFLQKRNALKDPLRIPTPPHIQAKLATSAANCADAITPDCIAQLYQIPPVTIAPSPDNSLGIFEEGDQYNQTDLNSYWAAYPSYGIPNGTAPILKSIDGGTAPGSLVDGESNLDFSLAFPIVYPQNVTLFQTDDQYWSAFGQGLFNTFLDAIDGSYCTSCYAGECGNADIDPVYPDTHGGYQGQLMCGTYKPTNVISISYGAAEDYIPQSYYERQCNEFMKLGLRGVSVFFASGDSGVASRSGCLGNSSTIFNPDWPAR
ncbi:hypothetical protein PENOC_085330 [Penicillium occitanis (nom. inval.)]|nr:hypothetical protein PENOC_085330 [Penicillium occitanis (nom. inval.)]